MFKGGKLSFKGSNKRYLFINSYEKCTLTLFSSSSGANKKVSKEEKEETLVLPKEITSLPDEGWTKATDLEDFLGPIIFIIPGDSFSLLKISEEGGNLSLESSPNDDGIPDGPETTANVLVGQNLIPQVFCFKSSFGKYLTTDSLGQVTCNKDAVNPLAEWTLILKPEGVSLESVNQKFLSFDPETGRLRCDSETIGFNETFIVKCQADRKKLRLIEKYKTERLATSKSSSSQQELNLLEENESKKMQSFGWGRSKGKSSSESKDLKRAADDGNLRETLLERRIKSKHDPFC